MFCLMGDGTGNGPAGRHVRQQKISAEPDVRGRAQCSHLRMNNERCRVHRN